MTLMGLYCEEEEEERSSVFLKTGHILNIFYRRVRDFLFTQWLNSFAMIGDNSMLIFVRATSRFCLDRWLSKG